MSETNLPSDEVQKLLENAGVDPLTPGITRRKWTRFETAGSVEFSRPGEKASHVGSLIDISEGGLAFLTDVSLAVGETLGLSYQETEEPVSMIGTVETVHSHPKEKQFLVGVKFL